jgi:hypothetical protein
MSTLKVNTIQNTSGVEVYTCKAWVNFNGTGTVAIRDEGNVSSITDNGLGDYTVNFTVDMTDENYSVIGTVRRGDATDVCNQISHLTAPSKSSVRVSSKASTANVPLDVITYSVAIFR